MRGLEPNWGGNAVTERPFAGAKEHTGGAARLSDMLAEIEEILDQTASVTNEMMQQIGIDHPVSPEVPKENVITLEARLRLVRFRASGLLAQLQLIVSRL